MTTKNGDLPAMPQMRKDPWKNYHCDGGLTKREMMAMHMMASLAKKFGPLSDWHDDAIDAVNAADALLAELARTE